MTTKLSTKPIIPIPKDIQEGDILVMRDGQRRGWTRWGDDGRSWCDGCHPGGHYPDGRWWGLNEYEFRPHGWDVVAIERKSQPKKARPDKDAAWLLKQAEDMSYTATKAFVRRLRAIAKRLNGGVTP